MSGKLSPIIRQIRAALPPDWVLWIPSRLGRRCGRWVQILSADPSDSGTKFVPTHGLMYLGDPWNTFVNQTVAGRRLMSERWPVDHWITYRAHEQDPAETIRRIVDQFRPRLDAPLSSEVIRAALATDTDNWSTLFALCAMSAEVGDDRAATHWLARFEASMLQRADPGRIPFLRALVQEGTDHGRVRAQLDAITARNESLLPPPLREAPTVDLDSTDVGPLRS